MAVKDQRKTLPFKTQPVIETVILGNERTGTLEFPRYNDLTVNESAWLTANNAAKTSFSYTSKLAVKIARKQKCTPLQAHGFVAKVMAAAMGAEVEFTKQENDWTVLWVRELEEVAMQVLETTAMQQNLLVTCLIRHRLKGMESWGPSDTTGLPTELVQAIHEFALEEQNRGVPQTVEEATEQLGELLKKSPTESGRKTPESTGGSSSTPSETSAPETQTSPTTDSETSAADTSSKS